MSDRVKLLKEYYDLFPFHRHPLWRAIENNELSKEQVVKAESQHYLRTKAGRVLRKRAMEQCANLSTALWQSIIDTYFEECTEEDGTPTHLDLVIRILKEGGGTDEELAHIKNTPGNIAAISLYENIADRGAGCHIIGAGMVEGFYASLCPTIFEAYTSLYGFSNFAAETYLIHGTMDLEHAERAYEVIDEAVDIHGWNKVESSVRDAFVATSLHYDGMLQGATLENNYWNGKG